MNTNQIIFGEKQTLCKEFLKMEKVSELNKWYETSSKIAIALVTCDPEDIEAKQDLKNLKNQYDTKMLEIDQWYESIINKKRSIESTSNSSNICTPTRIEFSPQLSMKSIDPKQNRRSKREKLCESFDLSIQLIDEVKVIQVKDSDNESISD